MYLSVTGIYGYTDVWQIFFFYFICVNVWDKFCILKFIVTKLDQWKVNKNYELCCNVSCVVESLMFCTPHQIFWRWNQEEWYGWCLYHILGEKRHFYMVLVVKTKGKWPLGKPVHELEGNMKTDLKEIRWEDMDWIYLAEDKDRWQALINVTMELLVSYIAENFLITWGITMLACQANMCSI